MPLLSHVQLGTNDLAEALRFYAPLMQTLGLIQHFAEPGKWAGWRQPGQARPLFIIGRPFDGNDATAGNGQMVALLAASHQAVATCHAQALQSGGRDEGAPALRPLYHPDYYGGYFRDPEGNKICVVCHDRAGRYVIQPDDLTGPACRELVALHLAGMHENSPPEAVFALDSSALQGFGIQFFTARDGESLAGMVALKAHDGPQGEIKSMRTHPHHLRRGVGRRMLAHVLAVAAAQGITRLSLETGSGPAFEPALALYRRHGFTNGGAFGEYRKSAFNQFLHLDL